MVKEIQKFSNYDYNLINKSARIIIDFIDNSIESEFLKLTGSKKIYNLNEQLSEVFLNRSDLREFSLFLELRNKIVIFSNELENKSKMDLKKYREEFYFIYSASLKYLK